MIKKPIHKFNNGLGATLCNKCNKIITYGMTDELYCNDCNNSEPKIDLSVDNFVLTRLEDNKQIPCSEIKYIEWDENSGNQMMFSEPAVGRSIIADPIMGGLSYKWMTTQIVEIVEENKFKTSNSTYVVHKV